MKFAKNVVTLGLLSAMALPAMAEDELVTIYGKANLTVQSSDEGEGSFSEVKSNASRIGFKGGLDINDSLEVIYKAEFQVDLAGDSEKGDSITDRNQYLGLKGNFGEVLIGRNDTILKQSQGKVDLFSDLESDIKVLWAGENRMADSITYKSPKFSGFQFGATMVTDEEVDGDNAYSLGVFYGDSGLKKSKIYASVAFDSEMKSYDTMRATVQGKVAGFVLGGIYHMQEHVDTGVEKDGFLFSAKYKIDKVTLKGQVQTASEDGGADQSSFTVGADYGLHKTTKLFAFYSTFDMDEAESGKKDKDYLAVGIEYKF